MPAMTLAEKLRRTRDWGAQEIAARLPLRIKYFTTMQMVAAATRNSPDIPGTKLEDILRELPAPKNLN